MAIVLISAETCRVCSKPRPPSELIPFGGGTYKMCQRCYAWHQEAVLFLSRGRAPSGCAECGLSREALQAAAGGGELRMYVHAADGVYLLLCRRCSDKVELLQRFRYKGTPYGAAKGLN